MTWFDWLIPPALRADVDSVADARRLVGIVLGFMCGGAVAAIAVSALTVYTGVGVVVAVGECFCVLVLMLFRTTGATRLTLFCLSIVVASTLVTTSWAAGGAIGPLAWLVILPFLGAMVVRSQNVAVHSGVAVVAVVVDLAFRLEGTDLATLSPEDAVSSISLVFAIVVSGGLGILTSRSYQNTVANLRRLNEDVETKNRELALSNQYKSEFLANMSHELRTPLNSLLILADNLSQNNEGNLTEDQVTSAQIIHSGGRSLLSLINDILDLSKVEAGKLEVELQRAETDSVIFGLGESFAPVANERGVEFVVERLPDVPAFIRTDSQRAQQILKNFLSNAFKFTEQGSVTLRVFVPESGVRFTNADLTSETTVGFSVIDTGIGIPADRQAAVFEAFRQAEGGTSRKYGGTGLGLSISREFTRLLGGEIHVESQPGEGSVFTLYLPRDCPRASARERTGSRTESPPVSIPGPPSRWHDRIERPGEADMAPQRERSAAENPPEPEKVLQGRTVMLVDDDMRNAFALSKVLRERGLEVVVADNGQVALEKLEQQNRVDLVIMDIMMPVMDGYEAMRRIRKDDRISSVPILALTANAMAEDREKCLHAGANGYLSKPVDVEELVSLLRVWLFEAA